MASRQSFYLDSLVNFITFHASEVGKVSAEQSQANLEQNVVRIYSLRKDTTEPKNMKSEPLTSACGVRLTTDGYILTAYYVIGEVSERGARYFAVYDQENHLRPLDLRLIVADPEHDLAMVKTYSTSVGEGIRFNIIEELSLLNEPVSTVVLTHLPDERRVVSREGKVLSYLPRRTAWGGFFSVSTEAD